MRRFLSVFLLTCIFGGNVFAISITIPHEFQPGTPANANEVNENFGSLVQALSQIKTLNLYQNNAHKGKALLFNFILLNSGYLTAPYKFNTSSNIYLKNIEKDIFFAASDCTGQPYIETPLELDFHAGEVGILAGIRNQAYTMSLPSAGQTISVGSYYSDGFTWYDETNNYQAVYEPAGCHAISLYSKQYYSAIPPAPLYSVQPNNSSITGVTTEACVKTTNGATEPAICFNNAQLLLE